MKTSWYQFAVIALALLPLCLGQLAAQSKLHTAGNKILDNNNAVYTLRGVSMVNAEVLYNGSKYNYRDKKGLEALKAEIDVIKWDYRANVVRLPIDPYTINGVPAGVNGWFYNPEKYWKDYLEPTVSYIISQKLYVILDFHLIASYNDQTKDQVIAFWRYITDQKIWNNHPQVLFEIYSGPAWWNADTIPTAAGKWDYAETEYKRFRDKINQPVIDYIRQTAKCDNIIIANSPAWSQLAAHAMDLPLAGGNIVYGLHVYPIQKDYFYMYWHPTRLKTMASEVPTMATEWGFQIFPNSDLGSDSLYCNGADYYKSINTTWGLNFMAWMETNGTSWTACNFDYYQVYCGPRMFRQNNFSIQSSNDFAYIVKEGLLKNPNPISSVFMEGTIDLNITIVDNHITLTDFQDLVTIKVVDIYGQTIPIGSNYVYSLDVSSLPSGCYFLVLQTREKINYHKFIKQS